MTDLITRGADAMRAKRRELITQPLDRIWPELMRAAVETMREPTEAMASHGWPETWKAMIDEALKAQS